MRVVGIKVNCPSELVCANKPGWSPTEIVAPWMGFLVVASITVPDAAGETYVVISMQPLSEIRNARATTCRHLLMCGLTVKLRPRLRHQTALRSNEAHRALPKRRKGDAGAHWVPAPAAPNKKRITDPSNDCQVTPLAS